MDQTTIKNSTQVSNGSQQQKSNPLSALVTPYYNTIMTGQTIKILQGTSEEKRQTPTEFSSQWQRRKTPSI